jgi:FdhE protein
VPAFHPDILWQLADARWRKITGKSSDLEPAVRLQRRLLRIILDASAGLDETAHAGLAESSILEKWCRGAPALHNETRSMPPRLKTFLPPLCTALAEGGAGDSARHVEEALATGAIDADSMLRVSLARNKRAIRTSALHMGLAPDLVWLIGELGSSPLANHLQERWSSVLSTKLEAGLVDWDRGYCPFCGSWPAFIEARGDFRWLRCSFCALEWRLSSNRCIYCGNQDADFVAAAPDDRGGRVVELCGSCAGYTKVLELAAATPFPLLAVEDLATVDLDQGAMERGYRRPDLYDLGKIEPFTSTC